MADITSGQKVVAGYWEGVDPSENEIEKNKAVTIDVSAYTEPVAVTPTSPNDAMKKVTVTLSNIKVKLFVFLYDTAVIYTKTAEPTTSDKALVGASTGLSESAITAVGDEFASITVSTTEYARYETGDVAIN